jgi:hypothetical protein
MDPSPWEVARGSDTGAFSQNFMEFEVSLPYSLDLTTGSCPEPHESS